jgi:hypothetical protein
MHTMKRSKGSAFALGVCVAAFVAACDDDDDRTTTTSSVASSSSSTGGEGGSGGATGGGGAGGGSGGTGGSGGAGGSSAGGGGAGGGAGAAVVINEVAPDPELGSDWIELFNPGGSDLDLGGYSFTDSDPTHVFTFAPGTMLAAGGYLVLVQDDPGSFDFGLGTGGDQVNLFDPSSTPVDSTQWTAGQADAPTTWGRLPNGSGAFQTLAAASQGAENQ